MPDYNQFINNPKEFQKDVRKELLDHSINELTEKTLMARELSQVNFLDAALKQESLEWDRILQARGQENYGELAEQFNTRLQDKYIGTIENFKNEATRSRFLTQIDNFGKEVTSSAIKKDYNNALEEYSQTIDVSRLKYQQALKSGDVDQVKEQAEDFLNLLEQARASDLMDKNKYVEQKIKVSEQLRSFSINSALNKAMVLRLQNGPVTEMKYLKQEYPEFFEKKQNTKSKYTDNEKLKILKHIEKAKAYQQRKLKETIGYGISEEKQYQAELVKKNIRLQENFYRGKVSAEDMNKNLDAEIKQRNKTTGLEIASSDPSVRGKIKTNRKRIVERLKHKKIYNSYLISNMEDIHKYFKGNKAITGKDFKLELFNKITEKNEKLRTIEFQNDLSLFLTETKKAFFDDAYEITPYNSSKLVNFMRGNQQIDENISKQAEALGKYFQEDKFAQPFFEEVGQSLALQDKLKKKGKSIGLSDYQAEKFKKYMVKALTEPNTIETKKERFKDIVSFIGQFGRNSAVKLFTGTNYENQAFFDTVQVLMNAEVVPEFYDSISTAFLKSINPKNHKAQRIIGQVKKQFAENGIDEDMTKVYESLNPLSREGGRHIAAILIADHAEKTNFSSIHFKDAGDVKKFLKQTAGYKEYVDKRAVYSKVNYFEKTGQQGKLQKKGYDMLNRALLGGSLKTEDVINDLGEKIERYKPQEPTFTFRRAKNMQIHTKNILYQIAINFERSKGNLNPSLPNLKKDYRIVDEVLQVRIGDTDDFTDMLFIDKGQKQRVFVNPERLAFILQDKENIPNEELKQDDPLESEGILWSAFTVPEKVRNELVFKERFKND